MMAVRHSNSGAEGRSSSGPSYTLIFDVWTRGNRELTRLLSDSLLVLASSVSKRSLDGVEGCEKLAPSGKASESICREDNAAIALCLIGQDASVDY